MPVGNLVVVTMHEDADGMAVLDRVEFRPWTHDTGATTGTAVVEKDDITASLNDGFQVQWSVVIGDIATWLAKSGATLLTEATAAVNAVFPSGGGVGPST